MAKYEIEHSCGHVETVDIRGTNVHGERERKAAWLAGRPCRACAEAAARERAEEAAKDEGMAELSGSARQVAWALDIRDGMLALLREEGERRARRAEEDGPGAGDAIRELVGEAVGKVKAVGSARWFIDHRGMGFSAALEAAGRLPGGEAAGGAEPKRAVFTDENRRDFQKLLGFMRERLAGDGERLAAVDEFERACREHMDDPSICTSGTLSNAIGEVWHANYSRKHGGGRSSFASVFKAAMAAARRLGL